MSISAKSGCSQHFSDRTPSTNRSNENQTSNSVEQDSLQKQSEIATPQNKLLPEVDLDSSYSYQADFKIALTGLAKGNTLSEIERNIESQSKFINSLKNSGASIRTLAKIIPYLDKVCTEAEATFKSLPEAEIKQLHDREITKPSQKPDPSNELSKKSPKPSSQTSTLNIEHDLA